MIEEPVIKGLRHPRKQTENHKIVSQNWWKKTLRCTHTFYQQRNKEEIHHLIAQLFILDNCRCLFLMILYEATVRPHLMIKDSRTCALTSYWRLKTYSNNLITATKCSNEVRLWLLLLEEITKHGCLIFCLWRTYCLFDSLIIRKRKQKQTNLEMKCKLKPKFLLYDVHP